jgi:hypothetical protein
MKALLHYIIVKIFRAVNNDGEIVNLSWILILKLPHFVHILCHGGAFLIANYHQTPNQCGLRVYRKTLSIPMLKTKNIFYNAQALSPFL